MSGFGKLSTLLPSSFNLSHFRSSVKPQWPTDDLIALWTSRASDYDATLDAQLDLSGNGHHLRLGSTVGADTNDPGRRLFTDEPYVYLPGTTDNTITVPNTGTKYWTAQFIDSADVTGSSDASPLSFGGTSSDFATKKLLRIILYSDSGRTTEVGRFEASGVNALGTQAVTDFGTWTINRSTTGLKTALVTRDMLHHGAENFMEAANDAAFNIPAGTNASILLVVRQFGLPVSQTTHLMSKYAGGSGAGWVLEARVGNIVRAFYRDGSTNFAADVAGPSNGQLVLLGWHLSNGGTELRAGVNTVLGAATAIPSSSSVSNPDSLMISGVDGAIKRGDFEFFGAAVYQKALSTQELQQLMNFYGVTP